MSTNGYFFEDYAIPDELQKLQEQITNNKVYMELEKIQRRIDDLYPPSLRDYSAKMQSYLNEYAATAAKLQEEIALYSPIFDELKRYEDFYDNAFASIAQNQAAMELMADIDSYAIRDIFSSFKESEKISQEINIDTASALYAEGKITDEDIAEEVGEMVSKKDFSLSDTWDNIKKSKWFLAIRVVFMILIFLASPAIDRAKDDILEKMGANEFWEESGVLEQIDKFFGIKSGAVSEQEAKDTASEENVGNISKKKREDLLQKIQAIRDYISAAPQDENTGNLLAYLSELEKDVNGKKYGLVFEEHREEIDEVLDTHTPVLTEEKGLFIDNGGQMNFLIEGDNLAALKLLEKTHRGKIDLIYIDPPYNTGNKDFVYDDIYVNIDDEYIHSKWLSFMNCRLQIARDLLSNTGICFISIDDHEQSNLKLLCDSIFGESCFVGMISVETSNGIFGLKAKHANKTIVKSKDYVLVYCISSDKLSFAPLYSQSKRNFDTHFTLFKDGDFECPLNDWLSSIDLINKRAERIGIKNNLNNLDMLMSMFDDVNDVILNNADKIYRIRDYTLRVDDKYLDDINDGKKVFISGNYVFKNNDGSLLYLYPFSQLVKMTDDYSPKKCSSVIVGDLWKGYNEDMGNIGKEGGIAFPNGKKPIRLIKNILKTANKKSATVLDFFAGSGTTGHAVMKLNAEDGGNRRFILCTNNENNICRDVTYERIKRVIDKESYAASLKYYRVDYVPIDERMYYEYANELLKHIRELVELENGVNFIGNAEIGIVLTEEELEAFVSNADAFSKCKKLYMGHDLLPTQEQEKALEERGIEISIIPDYYYRDLQER